MQVESIEAYRAKGARRLKESGLPHSKTEHWMKFDVSGLVENPFVEIVDKPESGKILNTDDFQEFADRIDILNGYPLLEERQTERLSRHYDIARSASQAGLVGDDRGTHFYNLNSSLIKEPLRINVKKGDNARPLHLACTLSSDQKDGIANPRITISVEEGAELNLIQSFRSVGPGAVFNNSVTEIQMEAGSRVNHLISTDRHGESTVFNNLFVNQMEGSEYLSHSFVSQSKMTRNEYMIALKEKDCSCSVNILYLGDDTELHNSDVTIHHEAPQCSSRFIARAIAGGESQGVFRGTAMIHEGAQKSDAVQQLKTILLTDQAQVNMEPHLEIWADDVNCSHGATVGQLDPRQLFYLQTRGFAPSEAKRILLEAFAAEISDTIRMEGIDEIVREKILKLMDAFYE